MKPINFCSPIFLLHRHLAIVAKGDLGGFLIIAKYKPPQSPLFKGGVQVAAFFKVGVRHSLRLTV